VLQDAYINNAALQTINKFKKTNSPKTKIIAITKTLSIEAVDSAIKNKINIIGENRVLEAVKKFKNYNRREQIELHFVGHLQSNKTKKAVQTFDVIQTADSIKLIALINKHAVNENKKQKIFLQINIGKDKKKHGFTLKELKHLISKISRFQNIIVKGLMTILPQNITKQQSKEYYIKLKETQQIIQKKHLKDCFYTSMGMSGDYQEAILAGASHIRIGTYLYGKRTNY